MLEYAGRRELSARRLDVKPIVCTVAFDFLVAECFLWVVRLTVKCTRRCVYVGVEAFCYYCPLQILTGLNSCSE